MPAQLVLSAARMNLLLAAVMLSQPSTPPLVPAEDTTVRMAVQPRGPFAPLEARPEVETAREPELRRLWELFVPASLVGFGGWLAAMVEADRCGISLFTRCEAPSSLSMIPIGGPFLAIARDGTSDRWFGTYLAVGLVQLGALAVMLAALVIGVPVGDGAR